MLIEYGIVTYIRNKLVDWLWDERVFVLCGRRQVFLACLEAPLGVLKALGHFFGVKWQ